MPRRVNCRVPRSCRRIIRLPQCVPRSTALWQPPVNRVAPPLMRFMSPTWATFARLANRTLRSRPIVPQRSLLVVRRSSARTDRDRLKSYSNLSCTVHHWDEIQVGRTIGLAFQPLTGEHWVRCRLLASQSTAVRSAPWTPASVSSRPTMLTRFARRSARTRPACCLRRFWARARSYRSLRNLRRRPGTRNVRYGIGRTGEAFAVQHGRDGVPLGVITVANPLAAALPIGRGAFAHCVEAASPDPRLPPSHPLPTAGRGIQALLGFDLHPQDHPPMGSVLPPCSSPGASRCDVSTFICAHFQLEVDARLRL